MLDIKVYGASVPIQDVGFQIYRSALLPSTLVAFSVPDHVSSELLNSSEWEAFQTLLEKAQEEDMQMRLQAEKERLERQRCKEISDPPVLVHENDNTVKRIVDKARKFFQNHL